MTEITLTKGVFSVTIYTTQVEDGYINKIFNITPATGKQSQDGGRKQTKVVDLLRWTRTFRILGFITSNADKLALINIIEGGGTAGGPITFSYTDGGDGTGFDVFCESCIITQKSSDEPTSPPSDFAKFDINITLIQGTSVG